jgi:hypothetical protein
MTNIIKELHLGANILLAYFHYCCKGCQPFALDSDAAEIATMAELNPEQIDFIQKTAGYVHLNSNSPPPPF